MGSAYNSDPYDAIEDSYQIMLGGVFYFFFTSDDSARFYFDAKSNYDQTYSPEFFVGYRQWVNV